MGEMVSYLPIDGSYVAYADRFVDESYGFAVGWTVFYNYSVTVAQEVVAVCGLINYWNVTINNAVWCTIFLVTLPMFHCFGVRWFGEGEFYFSIFKIFLILGLLVFTFITMLGGNPQHDMFGFRYWKNPGLFNEYIATGGWGRFLAMWATFVTAAFAYGGPDFLALAAGEAKYPRRVFPNVFRRVIWRLLVFYIGGVLAVGILVPYTDPELGGSAKGAGSSPFVRAMVRMHIPVLPAIVNACILSSAWSCGLANSYTASRVLYSMALRNQAPKWFAKTSRGVPINALVLVCAFAALSYMSASSSAGAAFSYITNLTGSVWIANMALQQIIYIRFRAGVTAQGVDRSKFPFFKKHQLVWSWIALVGYVLLFLFNGFPVFTKGRWSIRDFIFAYLTLVIILVLYFGHKAWSVARGGSWKIRTPEQVDLDTDRAEVDRDEETYPPYGTSRKDKFMHWLWGA